MPARIDMTGRVFGHWRVIRRAAGRVNGRHVAWWCRCAGCGTKKALDGSMLRRGQSSRCPTCAARVAAGKISEARRKYRPGDRVGRWTVRRWHRADQSYVCVCECGTVGMVRACHLTAGTSRGCGSCRNRDRIATT